MLKLKKIRFHMTPMDTLNMSRFPQNMWRGIYGKALHDLSQKPEYKDLYKIIYEGKSNIDRNVNFLRFLQPPKPIFFNFHGLKQICEKGDRIELEMTVIGDAIKHIIALVMVVVGIAKDGIGENKARLRIEKIVELTDGGEYLPVLNIERNNIIEFNGLEKTAARYDKAIIKFHTPVTLLKEKELNKEFQFEDLTGRFFERLTSISYHWCGIENVISYRDWIEEAKNIKITARELREVKNDRGKYIISGLKGEVTVEGENLSKFDGIFDIMEMINIGKNTEWGYGKVKVERM